MQYPSKRKRQQLALSYLASKFEADREYTEKEVNALLKQWHTFSDWAMLRRDLVDAGFLNRDKNGGLYWLEPNQPTLPDAD